MRLEALREPVALVNFARVNRGLFRGRDKLHPDVLDFWFVFQDAAAKHKIPLRVVWGYRSFEEQAEMVRRGVTRAKPGQSAHNYGMAVDVIHTRRAWEDMPRDGWSILGAIGHEAARIADVKMQWGGEWNFYDPAHWELRDWRARVSVET